MMVVARGAAHAYIAGYSTFWAPVINLAREPRWGRNLESAGEDPYLSGEYAVAFVTAFEKLPEDPTHLAASACCKHYVANSLEDSRYAGTHHTRYSADPTISDQDLVDSYMAPFQKCVEVGRVSSLMCSYNALNGALIATPPRAHAWTW
jgi:beta-glucosidase-like glycosyl hydrolase